MADVYYWLGDATETTATVIVRSDTAGSLALTGATNDGPHAVDPAVEYGIVKFTVSGLTADTEFAVQLDSVEQLTGTMRVMPASGAWRFGFGSCVGSLKPMASGYQMVLDHNIRAWFALGDTPYADSDKAANSLTHTRYTNDGDRLGCYKLWNTGRVAWDRQYEYLQKTPGWGYLTSHVPTYRLPDDHEYGNDWDWTLDNVSLFGAPAPAITTQAQVDEAAGYANAAAWSWNKGNPANADAEIGDWKPSSCADAVSNHPPKYYRKRVGDVEFFHIDCYGHMDPWGKQDKLNTVCIDNATWNAELGYAYSDPAGAALAKTRIGPYQLNWLLTRLAASTATFKVIMSGKLTYRANSSNDNEGWSGYIAERDYILAFIRRYVTGVLWCAGDVHTMSVNNQMRGHCCVNSSPLGVVEWRDGGGAVNYPWGYAEGMAWRSIGEISSIATGACPNGYGVVEVADDYSYMKPMLYSENGTLLWSAYLKAGKNYLQPTLDEPGEWA